VIAASGRYMSDRDRLRDRYPLGAGAAAGALAWVTGAIVTYLAVLFVLKPPDETGQTPDPSSGFGDIGEGVGRELAQSLAQVPFEGSGMLFFNAHFVPTEIDVLIFSESLNFVDTLGGPWTALYVLPPLALVVAGAAVVSRTPVVDSRAAAKTGAVVTAGYLPMVVIGTQLYTISISVSSGFSASISIGPSLVLGIVLAGLVYPLAFGAIGGFLGWRIGDTRGVPRDRPAPAGTGGEGPPDGDRSPQDGHGGCGSPDRDRASRGTSGEARDGYGEYGTTGRDRPPRGTSGEARDAGGGPSIGTAGSRAGGRDRRDGAESDDVPAGRNRPTGDPSGEGPDAGSDHRSGNDSGSGDVFGDDSEDGDVFGDDENAFDDWETPDTNEGDDDRSE